MAGMTFLERMRAKRAAMTPAERAKRDKGSKINAESNRAFRQAERSLKTMKPGQTRTLRGASVGGRAVQVHKGTGQSFMRMADALGGTSVFGTDKGRWVQQGSDPKSEAKQFGTAGLGQSRGKKSAKASSGHSGG